MNLADFYRQVRGVWGGENNIQIEVKLMTLDGTFPIRCIEVQQEGDRKVVYIQSDEPVHREPWEG